MYSQSNFGYNQTHQADMFLEMPSIDEASHVKHWRDANGQVMNSEFGLDETGKLSKQFARCSLSRGQASTLASSLHASARVTRLSSEKLHKSQKSKGRSEKRKKRAKVSDRPAQDSQEPQKQVFSFGKASLGHQSSGSNPEIDEESHHASFGSLCKGETRPQQSHFSTENLRRKEVFLLSSDARFEKQDAIALYGNHAQLHQSKRKLTKQNASISRIKRGRQRCLLEHQSSQHSTAFTQAPLISYARFERRDVRKQTEVQASVLLRISKRQAGSPANTFERFPVFQDDLIGLGTLGHLLRVAESDSRGVQVLDEDTDEEQRNQGVWQCKRDMDFLGREQERLGDFLHLALIKNTEIFDRVANCDSFDRFGDLKHEVAL